MKKLLFAILLSVLAQACIPLVDLFPPTIRVNSQDGGDLFAEANYYQDSIHLDVFYQDNASLNKWNLQINRLQVSNPEADWFFEEEGKFRVGTKAQETTISIGIPARVNEQYISTGDYELLLTLIDIDSNSSVFIDTFNIQADNTLPIFADLSPLLMREIPADAPAGTQYYTCPNQPVYFMGGVKDNTKLRRVGYSYTGAGDVAYPVRTSLFEYDSIAIDSYLNDSLSIIFPESLNGQLVNLSVFVEDIFLNRYDTTFNIYLNCDATAPTITYERLSNDPVNGVIKVVEGRDFAISNLLISDNQALQNVEIFFNDLSSNRQLFKEYVFNGSRKDTLIADFRIPSSMLSLNVSYNLDIVAHDTSTILRPEGNTTELSFELQVVEDKAPVISNMDFVLNEGLVTEERFIGILAGDTLSFSGVLEGEQLTPLVIDGKGDDDAGIVSLVMRWRTPSGVVSNLVQETFNPAEPVLKFTNFYDNASTFLLTEAGVYSVEVIMQDTKGQRNGSASPATQRTYYFNVVD